MKYKKTIRRSAQDYTCYKQGKKLLHNWANNRLGALRQREKHPEGAERQRVLAPLTNWQLNKLLQAVGGSLNEYSPEQLKIIVSSFKNRD